MQRNVFLTFEVVPPSVIKKKKKVYLVGLVFCLFFFVFSKSLTVLRYKEEQTASALVVCAVWTENVRLKFSSWNILDQETPGYLGRSCAVREKLVLFAL